jgi:hypothetical protein
MYGREKIDSSSSEEKQNAIEMCDKATWWRGNGVARFIWADVGYFEVRPNAVAGYANTDSEP